MARRIASTSVDGRPRATPALSGRMRLQVQGCTRAELPIETTSQHESCSLRHVTANFSVISKCALSSPASSLMTETSS
eukprot:CAMPEP_0195579824 /NCGR_PEP_ID=MMETSP0814-20130614/16262_1 /TAXON_ID=97485 /ORGANISM="Prymnesium parvum, Strain Texoma1" /LENGTH=77 /DNA_ID=CAMNT_0040716731 /DNA_START=238 /DNA_END=474 /DNA_ORIENTATION=-